MSIQNARFNFSEKNYPVIFQSSINENEFYGLGYLERKKLKIIQAKYGCRNCFHTLPNKVSLDLHKFTWDNENQCFEVDTQKVRVQLNTLEEAVIEYFTNDHMIE